MTHVRVLKDMEFLKKSWANMAENVATEADLLAAIELEPDQNADADGSK